MDLGKRFIAIYQTVTNNKINHTKLHEITKEAMGMFLFLHAYCDLYREFCNAQELPDLWRSSQ